MDRGRAGARAARAPSALPPDHHDRQRADQDQGQPDVLAAVDPPGGEQGPDHVGGEGQGGQAREHAQQEHQAAHDLEGADGERRLPGEIAEPPALEALDVGVVVDELAEPDRDEDRRERDAQDEGAPQRASRIGEVVGEGAHRQRP